MSDDKVIRTPLANHSGYLRSIVHKQMRKKTSWLRFHMPQSFEV